MLNEANSSSYRSFLYWRKYYVTWKNNGATHRGQLVVS